MAVTIFFSTLGSAILASVLGICVFVAGQLSHNVLSLTRLGKNAVTEALSWVVYVIVPNLSAVDVKAGVVGEQTLAWGQIGLWTAYLLAYMVVVLALADAGLPPQGVLSVLQAGRSPSSLVLLCAAGVVAYQATRPARRAGEPDGVRAVADVLPRLLAQLPHLDRRRLLPAHGAVLRRARRTATDGSTRCPPWSIWSPR